MNCSDLLFEKTGDVIYEMIKKYTDYFRINDVRDFLSIKNMTQNEAGDYFFSMNHKTAFVYEKSYAKIKNHSLIFINTERQKINFVSFFLSEDTYDALGAFSNNSIFRDKNEGEVYSFVFTEDSKQNKYCVLRAEFCINRFMIEYDNINGELFEFYSFYIMKELNNIFEQLTLFTYSSDYLSFKKECSNFKLKSYIFNFLNKKLNMNKLTYYEDQISKFDKTYRIQSSEASKDSFVNIFKHEDENEDIFKIF